MRNLAEAIILQSMGDFWSRTHWPESMEFFKSGGFRVCAEIAGMSREEQSKMLEILKGSFKSNGPLCRFKRKCRTVLKQKNFTENPGSKTKY